MPPKPRLRQNPTQNAASTPTSAKSISKCRDKPDMGRTDLKMPLKPRLWGKNELRMPCQARIRKNRSQNAAASSLPSAKPHSKGRRTKPDFGKTALMMPPKPLQRQFRPQNVAVIPTSAKPNSKGRRTNSDLGKIKLKMPRHQTRLWQNRSQKCRGVKPNSAKPGSKCHHNPDNSQKQNGHQARLRLNRTENAPSCPPAAQTDLKMSPEPRLRQNRSQNAAQTRQKPNIKLNSKCRLNPDFNKNDPKMPPKPSIRQSQTQNAAESNPNSTKPGRKMPPTPRLRQNRTQNAA